MSEPTLFIGLVSHEGSRFTSNQGPDGFVERVAAALRVGGLDVAVEVNTRDEYSPDLLAIDGSVAWQSIRETLRLEDEWHGYLREGAPAPLPSSVRSGAHSTLRHVKARARFWRPWHAVDRSDAPAIRLVRRLLNIELSHLRLMRHGIESGSEWTLIVEDDASTVDVRDCSDGLIGLMRMAGARSQPLYANVSESFTPDELGITHLLSPVPDVRWAGSASRSVDGSSRPVTNTVCAILYRSSFLVELVSRMDALPLAPVVPIDWKLNAALMAMFREGVLGRGDCWTVTPGPIDQLSMRPAAIMPR